MVAPSPSRWRRRLRITSEVVLVVIALGALGLWGSVPHAAALRTENPTSTAFIDLRREEAAAAKKPFKLRWQWRPLNRISRYLRAAVVYAEDGNFYNHHGVDWNAIEDAVERDVTRGALSVGGSSITQQLAKNLYLSPRRSFACKLREMLIAFSLEDHLSKQRILEFYLSSISTSSNGAMGCSVPRRPPSAGSIIPRPHSRPPRRRGSRSRCRTRSPVRPMPATPG